LKVKLWQHFQVPNCNALVHKSTLSET
jgi:hypothetical protein